MEQNADILARYLYFFLATREGGLKEKEIILRDRAAQEEIIPVPERIFELERQRKEFLRLVKREREATEVTRPGRAEKRYLRDIQSGAIPELLGEWKMQCGKECDCEIHCISFSCDFYERNRIYHLSLKPQKRWKKSRGGCRRKNRLMPDRKKIW